MKRCFELYESSVLRWNTQVVPIIERWRSTAEGA
jgi:hypothetical protein